MYLDEDLDEEGNVKPGLDTGLPFDKMEKVGMERDETRSNDSEDGSSKEGSVEGKKTNGIAYDDDDVDWATILRLGNIWYWLEMGWRKSAIDGIVYL